MTTHIDKSEDKIAKSHALDQSNEKDSAKGISQIVDNRPEATTQRKLINMVNNSPVMQQKRSLQSNVAQFNTVQLRGRDHADRIYRVTVSASWPIDGEMHHEGAETYDFPYTSDEMPTAPLERQAKRQYRAAHPDVPNGGPQMRMHVNGRAMQG
jgi:hypothetical protein